MSDGSGPAAADNPSANRLTFSKRGVPETRPPRVATLQQDFVDDAENQRKQRQRRGYSQGILASESLRKSRRQQAHQKVWFSFESAKDQSRVRAGGNFGTDSPAKPGHCDLPRPRHQEGDVAPESQAVKRSNNFQRS